MLSLKAVEIHQGKRVSMDVNLRSQEDVIPWANVPPHVQAALEVIEGFKDTRALPAGETT